MFGHLRSHEYMDLIEGIPLGWESEKHLALCARCRKELDGLGDVRRLVAETARADDDQPEPEWTTFRSEVRDRLLSRSLRRERVLWTGWLLRPMPAWTLALFAAVGFAAAISIGQPDAVPAPTEPVMAELELAESPATVEDVLAVWSNASVFEEVSALGPEESERLRELLEYETQLSGAASIKAVVLE